MNTYDPNEKHNYDREERAIRLLKSDPKYDSLQIMTNSEMDYKYGIDLVYGEKTIDLKANKNRENLCLSFCRENKNGVWYQVLPSKADVIWYWIEKPFGGVLYEINQKQQWNLVHDIPILNLENKDNIEIYGRRQIVLYADLSRDRYATLIDRIDNDSLRGAI